VPILKDLGESEGRSNDATPRVERGRGQREGLRSRGEPSAAGVVLAGDDDDGDDDE
jgi:hypothetical protein